MSELTLTLIKLGFLAVLWLFVLSAVSVIRSDIIGTKAPATASRPASAGKEPKAKREKEPRAPKAKRGVPTKLQIVGGPNTGQSVPLGDQLTGAEDMVDHHPAHPLENMRRRQHQRDRLQPDR